MAGAKVKILLFGANGQVGSACQSLFSSVGACADTAQAIELITLTHKHADFAFPENVLAAVLENAPDIVVNACAYTAVDKAEAESELAYAVNAKSVEALGRACQQLGIPCIHISTDYVFDGSAQGPYSEASNVAPLGVYGGSKYEGERLLQLATEKVIVLRTSWVFGLQGNNFVKTMLRLGAEREELGVVADQRGCPTFAGDIAMVIGELIAKYRDENTLAWGVYHCSNSGSCSWYDFAQTIFSQGVEQGLLAKEPVVNPITTDQYPTPAKRPANSVLNCAKLEQLLGRDMPHWRSGLQQLCISLKLR